MPGSTRLDLCRAPLERAGGVTLYRQIADRLRLAVLSGAPRLPTERDLAAGFSVARITVRAALDIVETEGLISRHRRRGTMVRTRSAGVLERDMDAVASGLE